MYRCVCDHGYGGDGYTCEDIDEYSVYIILCVDVYVTMAIVEMGIHVKI